MIAVNTFYVTSKIDEMLNMCEALKTDNSAEATEKLLAAWQSYHDIIALSVHRLDLERAEDAILALEKYREIPADFNYQLSILITALKHIGDSQRIKLNSVF
ncbi:MAG: DUF4363 family protein [Clostridia bacterium]|nr:DUF4363 family protein [Clostridia bacterium]